MTIKDVNSYLNASESSSIFESTINRATANETITTDEYTTDVTSYNETITTDEYIKGVFWPISSIIENEGIIFRYTDTYDKINTKLLIPLLEPNGKGHWFKVDGVHKGWIYGCWDSYIGDMLYYVSKDRLSNAAEVVTETTNVFDSIFGLGL